MLSDNTRTIFCICYGRGNLSVWADETVWIEIVRVSSLRYSKHQGISRRHYTTTHIGCWVTVHTPRHIMRFLEARTCEFGIVPYVG